MGDPRRGQLCIVEGREDGGGCEMKRGRLGTDGESVSMKKEEEAQSHNAALWKRKGKRRAAAERQGERGGVAPGVWEVGNGVGSISISKPHAVCSHLRRQLSLAVSLVEPPLPYHPEVTLLGVLFVIIQVYLLQWKEF